MVADVHRILLEGGIYFYPADVSGGGKGKGKLRVLYECQPQPMAFVIEQAGGAASTGEGRVLDVKPDSLHARIPFFIGSRTEVDVYERFQRGERP
jgi:fructose-1,6-bisphosphatase I